MNLREEILLNYSATQANKIANYIGADEDRFAELIQLFLKGEYRLTQISSWIVGKCADKHPFLLKPYTAQLLTKIKEPNIHDSVKRNVVRIWQEVELPDEFIGEIYDTCFNFLLSSTETIAIKVFSMSVLLRIVQKNPELKEELKYAIKDQLMKFSDSPAIASRGRKVLKAL